MQTLTIKASPSLLNQILAISKALANAQNEPIEAHSIDMLKADYEQRANEALQGIGLLNQDQAKQAIEQIKDGTYASRI
ncbi:MULTISPECIES: hypothetical protein [unclassified Campylobacter]|uniref:hypothetical protein n=1 Tax=unclassified Campylobacter TaxID=2593542 RepID=UPI003D33F280